MFFYVGIILSILVLLSSGFGYSQVNLSLSPLLHQIEVYPGQKVALSSFLAYEGDEQATIRVFATDFAQSRSGLYRILDEPEPDKPGPEWKFSAVSWIKIKDDDRQFTISPGGEREVVYEVQVPRDPYLAGGRYAAIVFELLPLSQKPGDRPLIGTSYHYQMVSFIEISIKGSRVEQKLSFTNLEIVSTNSESRYVRKFGQDAHIYTASVTNEGNIHVEAEGKLLIRSSQGRIIREVPLGGGRGVILPQTTANFTSVVKDPRPGEYIAEAVFEYDQSRRPVVFRKRFAIGEKYADKDLPSAQVPALSLNTESLDAQIPAGGFRSFLVVAENNEDTPLDIQARVVKFSSPNNESNQAFSLSERSCINWLQVSPQRFMIPPHRNLALRIGVTVPRDAQGESYAYINFQTNKKGHTGSNEGVNLRLPVMIGVAGTLKESAEIVSANLSTENPKNLVVEVKNTGNVHLEINGTIDIFNSEDAVIEEKIPLQGNKVLVFPGDKSKMRFSVKEPLSPGNYKIQANFAFGKNDTKISKQLPFVIE